MAHHPRSGKIPARSIQPIDPEGWDKDPGRPLALRLLALLGARSFLALWISRLLQQPAANPAQKRAHSPAQGIAWTTLWLSQTQPGHHCLQRQDLTAP